MLHFHNLRPIVSTFLVAAFLTSNAQAVSLANIEGAVTVNSGKGFQPASIGSSLAPGDRVRTGDGAVDIVYDNGCSTHVAAKQVALVLSTPPSCFGGVGYGGLKDGAAVAPAETDWNPVLAAGVFAAGGFVGVFVTNHNESHPVSP
jgi:hypothetical protein